MREVRIGFFAPGMFLIILLIGHLNWVSLLSLNINNALISKSWLGLKYNGPQRDHLNDEIPDAWDVVRWGSSTGISKVEYDPSRYGQVAKLMRTNKQGVIALIQDLVVEPNSQLVFSVHAKGQTGAIEFRFFSTSAGNWITNGWRDIPESVDWKKYQLTTTAPSDAIKARVLLRTGGTLWFDEASLAFVINEEPSGNVLKNSSFEYDGVTEDPIVWWKLHFFSETRLQLLGNLVSDRLSYLNIVDFLSGRYDDIRQRSDLLGENCALFPEMTSWLTASGKDDRSNGGATVGEYLFRLAIDLAPNCPQPYADLAKLYESHGAHLRASELYRRAAQLSEGTSLAGRYYFEEGFLHIRHTGDLENAVFALERAEQITGWQRGRWYRGATPFYLGVSFEALGKVKEASKAFQRVVDCGDCTYHHDLARNRLIALEKGSN